MNYIKTLFLASITGAAAFSAAAADSEAVVTLDLTKAATELVFDKETGAWDKTYSEEDPTIDSQLFCFLHNAMESYQTWWGFTASNSANNLPSDDYIKYQFSSMAKGGIALDENGAVKKNEYGDPVVSDTIPYLVAFYAAYMSKRPVDVVFNDGLAHQAVGCYVNLNSYCYYTTLLGDSFCRRFASGDKFTLTIHGVAEDASEKTVEVSLASADNGYYTAATGWTYVDLTPLGAVNELYFTLDSTDSGAWGMNTPGYFCLDKLMVSEQPTTSVSKLGANSTLSYNRAAKTISNSVRTFIAIYNTAGQLVKSDETDTMDLNDIEHGVYIARAGDNTLKIVI